MKKEHTLIVYQTKTGAIELRTDLPAETFWATQAQIAEIFDTTPQNITLHLKNIFKENELSQDSTCKESLQVQKEGGRTVQRRQKFYNLDAIISVGYRISSVAGTKFRQWATKTLRTHIIDGYTINKKRLAKNYSAFIKVVEQIKTLLPSGGAVDAVNAMELVKMFANTWFSLDAYDKSKLPKNGATKRQVEFATEDLKRALQKLKHELISKSEATGLFGSERGGQSMSGIIGNIFQTFGGQDLYQTIEEKAAHLLYFMVKNHPYVDGNKRSGAFAFVWFLKQAGILNPARLTAEALTALTLFVAESNPKDKDKIVGLILLILN